MRQSGVIPFRGSGSWFEILLVTTRSGKRWIVPKGNVKPDLGPAQSAVEEAYEEAGVRGVLDPNPVGRFTVEARGRRRIVELFPLQVTAVYATWEEMFVRDRAWLSVDAARERVDDPDLSVCLEAVSQRYVLNAAAPTIVNSHAG